MSGVACSFPQIDEKVLSTFIFKTEVSKCKDYSRTSGEYCEISSTE